ncbi:MAG: hypothetical protein K6T88_18045 [Bacillus sp. (in: Bacteria)]|nr:hypothetical protein [Bacillus sp. (in: firmicutes)]
METFVQQTPDQTVSKMKGFSDAALQAVTGDMVTEIAAKLVKAVEIIDDVIQPETLELLRVLPEVSKSLEHILLEVKKLEEKGTLTTLFEAAEMIQSMKSALTGSMVTDLMEKAVKGVVIADDMLQIGTGIADDMAIAFHSAKEERKGKKPMSIYRLIRSLSDKKTREVLSLVVTFLQKMPNKTR